MSLTNTEAARVFELFAYKPVPAAELRKLSYAIDLINIIILF